MWRSRLGLLAWFAVLVTVAVGLPTVAPAVSPPPVLRGLGAIGRWADGRSAPDLVAGVLRLVVGGLAWYLLAATVVAVVLRLADPNPVDRDGGPGLGWFGSLVLLPPVRRAAAVAFGAGLSAAAVVHAAPATASTDGPAGRDTSAVVMQRLSDAGTDPLAAMRRMPEGAASMTRLPDGEATAGDVTETTQATDIETGRRWRVESGQHLWSIAEQVLSDHLDRPASDAEIDPFWRRIVAENRAELADPDNPDLVFPGQVLFVPDP